MDIFNNTAYLDIRCTYELLVIVTTGIKSTQTQALQNSTKEKQRLARSPTHYWEAMDIQLLWERKSQFSLELWYMVYHLHSRSDLIHAYTNRPAQIGFDGWEKENEGCG